MKNNKRIIYFIGIPDRMNNSWWLTATGLTKSEAENNFHFLYDDSEWARERGHDLIKETRYEEYTEENGYWDIIKVTKGWE